MLKIKYCTLKHEHFICSLNDFLKKVLFLNGGLLKMDYVPLPLLVYCNIYTVTTFRRLKKPYVNVFIVLSVRMSIVFVGVCVFFFKC